MSRLSQGTNSVKASKSGKLVQIIFGIILGITILGLLWVVLLFMNNGLRMSPIWILFGTFIVIVVAGCLLYRQNYRRILQFCQQKFPSLTGERVLQICFIVAIIAGIIMRLFFLRYGSHYDPAAVLSDTGFPWHTAQSLATGSELDVYSGGYGAVFPHLMAYSATLAGAMKIFGVGYQAVIFSNLIFDLLAAVSLYFLLKNFRNAKVAKIGVMIWLLNPLEIIFCAVGVSIVITNLMLVLSLLVAELILKSLHSKSWLKLVIFSMIFGVLISIGNAYRPIFTVLLIAMIMIFVLEVIKNWRATLLRAGGSVVLIIGMMFGINSLINLGQQAINPYAVSGGGGIGWNFFVGANYDSQGRWTAEDSAVFGEMLYQETKDGTVVNPDIKGMQSELFQMGMERYRSMNITQLVSHLLNKTSVLFTDPNNDVAWVYKEAMQLEGDQVSKVYLILESSGVLAMFCGFVLSLLYLISVLRDKTQEWQPYLLFLMLCFCGIIAASLLVEVMRRYVMSLTVFLVVFAACYLGQQCLHRDGKTSRS